MLLLSLFSYGAGGECNASERPFLTVLTTLPFLVPRDASSVRSLHFSETILAISQNTMSPFVEEVHVVLDSLGRKGVSDLEATRRLRLAVRSEEEKTGGVSGSAKVMKLTASVYGRQPTYADMFRYANGKFPGKLLALTNADVVLRNVDKLDREAFRPPETTRRLAFALSVHPPANGTCKPTSRCVKNQGSWDVHVFESPLPHSSDWYYLDELQPGPVFMNELGAENRVGIFLHASGYDLKNPCLHIIAEHYHCAPKTHHTTYKVWDWDLHKHLRLPGHIVDPEETTSTTLRGLLPPGTTLLEPCANNIGTSSPRRKIATT